MDYPTDERMVRGRFGRWTGYHGVPEAGFQWVRDEYEVADPNERALGYTTGNWGPWLIPAAIESEPASRPIDVLSDRQRPGLHRQLARLADGREESRLRRVQRFASHYGFLREDRLFELVQTKMYGPRSVKGESWRTWELAIFRIAAVVALWDLVRARNREELTRLVRWSTPPHAAVGCIYRNGRLFEQPPPIDKVDSAWVDEDWRGGAGVVEQSVRLDEYAGSSGNGESGWGDPVTAARLAVYQEIEEHLHGNVSVVLERSDSPDLWNWPSTLHAAIYLHFAYEISGRRRSTVQCMNPRCNRHFEPTHGAQRYCGRSCRNQTDYDRRKQRSSSDDHVDDQAGGQGTTDADTR